MYGTNYNEAPQADKFWQIPEILLIEKNSDINFLP